MPLWWDILGQTVIEDYKARWISFHYLDAKTETSLKAWGSFDVSVNPEGVQWGSAQGSVQDTQVKGKCNVTAFAKTS